MDRQHDSESSTIFLANSLQKDENTKLRVQKFIMFFAGLVFATLSFMGTHPIQTKNLLLKIFETISLSFLLLCGIILLIRLAEYKVKNIEKEPCKLKRLYYEYTYRKNSSYWFFFISGMILMVLDRSVLTFLV